MTEPARNYIPQDIARHFHSQACKVWGVTLAILFVWVFAIILAPLALENGWIALSSPLYYFFSFICHQIPERSFHIAGEQFAVCSRCFGVYFGLLLGFAFYPLWRNISETQPLPKVWLFLSLIPVSADWSLTFFGIWENTNLSRFLTGTIVGVACSTFIIPSLVEITRNMAYGRRKRPLG